jgi:hypothetical protein
VNSERSWNVATVGAIIVMVALVAYHLIVPMPAVTAQQQRKKNERDLAKTRDTYMRKSRELQKTNADRLWDLGPESLGPMAMGKVSNLSKSFGLKMVSFRPQKQVDSGDLVRYGYLVSVEGTFPKVIEFVRKLETPETKLAVSSLQVTSTDGASDAVSATVGVVAYRDRLAGVKALKTAKNDTASTLASEEKKKP